MFKATHSNYITYNGTMKILSLNLCSRYVHDVHTYVGDSANPPKRSTVDDHIRLHAGLSSSPTSLPGSSMILDQNPYNLKEGSAVKCDYPPKYGVVKWIGVTSGHDKTLYAGVEMVSQSVIVEYEYLLITY